MRQIVLVVPDALSLQPDESLIATKHDAWERFSATANLRRLHPCAAWETAVMGFSEDQLPMADGPLFVAALGVSPPDSSLQFCLSLRSCDADGVLQVPEPNPRDSDIQAVLEAAERLNNRWLTLVRGGGLEHALVFEEARPDLVTVPPEGVIGTGLAANFPEGDGEKLLRQYIDDSVNLLSDLECNARRQDEGLMPLNVLWPWGQGFRLPLSNLPLRRGGPFWIGARSFRVRGLARLTGYPVTPPVLFGNDFRVDWQALRNTLETKGRCVFVFEAFQRFHGEERFDTGPRWWKAFLDQMLAPIIESPDATETQLQVVFPRSSSPQEWVADVGLAARWDGWSQEVSSIPCDERALDEPRIPTESFGELMSQALVVRSFAR